jgi:hypothetical protein
MGVIGAGQEPLTVVLGRCQSVRLLHITAALSPVSLMPKCH